jgi:predicted alpha/beta hydrolase family esterase
MREAVFIHDKERRQRLPAKPVPPLRAHWLPWAATSIGDRGIPVHMPALPTPQSPSYRRWKRAFEAAKILVTPQTALVGDGVGAGFLLRWLTDTPNTCAEHLVLVKPAHNRWLQRTEAPDNKGLDRLLLQRVGRLTVFHSLDDSPEVAATVATIQNTYESPKLHVYTSQYSAQYNRPKFPELLAVLFDPL